MTGTALIAIGGNALVLRERTARWSARRSGRPSSAPNSPKSSRRAGASWSATATGLRSASSSGAGKPVAPEAAVEGLPNLPLWLAVADSQGGIGHILTLEIDNALRRRALATRAVTVLTHTEVDPKDPAFQTPTKPIGGTMTADTARLRTVEAGWSVVETSAGVYRRVVPSPSPWTSSRPIRSRHWPTPGRS